MKNPHAELQIKCKHSMYIGNYGVLRAYSNAVGTTEYIPNTDGKYDIELSLREHHWNDGDNDLVYWTHFISGESIHAVLYELGVIDTLDNTGLHSARHKHDVYNSGLVESRLRWKNQEVF